MNAQIFFGFHGDINHDISARQVTWCLIPRILFQRSAWSAHCHTDSLTETHESSMIKHVISLFPDNGEYKWWVLPKSKCTRYSLYSRFDRLRGSSRDAYQQYTAIIAMYALSTATCIISRHFMRKDPLIFYLLFMWSISKFISPTTFEYYISIIHHHPLAMCHIVGNPRSPGDPGLQPLWPKQWRSQEKLDELEVCQPAIFVAAMCGLEWLKDQEPGAWRPMGVGWWEDHYQSMV